MEPSYLLERENDSPPEVSVIVAAYNQWRHLGAQLDCLQRQRNANFEVLVCDDGSAVDMLGEVRRREGLDIRYIWQPDLGFRLSRSRNNGIRCARGRVLLFVDADEIFGPDFVARHAAMHPPGRLRLVTGSRRPALVAGEEPGLDIELLWREMESWPPAVRGRQLVQNWAERPSKWMGIIGGNFSATRSDAVVFDEDFVGWGFEDCELGYRLLTQHGYEMLFEGALEVVHLSWNGERASETPIDGSNPEGPFIMLERALRFVRKHPSMDLRDTIPALQFAELDEAAGLWKFNMEREPRDPHQVLAELERFMHQRRQQSR